MNDIREIVSFQKDTACDDKDVVQRVEAGEILQDIGHVFDGREKAGQQHRRKHEAEHADEGLLLSGTEGGYGKSDARQCE